MLPAPGFHHLHLNSVDPDAAIAFYVRHFPTSTKTRWGGLPALAAPNDVLMLFTRVATPPPTSPQTAIWHFGWHVPDTRASLETFEARPDLELLPLYTTDEGGSVLVSSDTWPSKGPTPGLTKAQIAEARATGAQPTRTGGFGYMRGPDDALVEYAGNHPAERFNHVHLYQDDPFCAQLWYQTHLNAPIYAGRTSAHADDRGHLRGAARARSELAGAGSRRACSGRRRPRSCSATWPCPGTCARATGRSRARAGSSTTTSRSASPISTPGSPSCAARASGSWRSPTALGDTRAVMIEGPSREALELVEVS